MTLTITSTGSAAFILGVLITLWVALLVRTIRKAALAREDLRSFEWQVFAFLSLFMVPAIGAFTWAAFVI